MRDKIYGLYHRLQQSKSFICIVAWLQQHYITILIGDIVNISRIRRDRNNPEEYLKKSRDFFSDNYDRVQNVKNFFCDEMSRKVYDAAIRYRTHRRMLKRGEWSLRDQYFVKKIVSLGKEEVFIDGGAYNGDTIDKLYQYREKFYKDSVIKRVVAFEPAELSMGLLAKKYGKHKEVLLKKSGLSDKNGDLYFCERGSSSYLTTKDKSNRSVHVSAIDDIEECEDATFIKMDIEGAEWDALHGAEKTILKNKPKLAICIYHSDEDMIRIPEYIHDLVPGYKLYIRHHTRRDHETVLYAIPDVV